MVCDFKKSSGYQQFMPRKTWVLMKDKVSDELAWV